MSTQALLPVAEALARLLADAVPLAQTQSVPLAAARHRVLAEPLVASLDVPPADNSSMDGYALRHADIAAGQREFPVAQRVSAGSVGAQLAAGTAARIFTGAEIPPGADCVVIQENCEAGEGSVRVLQPPQPGENIRRRGQDIARGNVFIEAGSRLLPAHVGLAASMGIERLGVYRRLRVGILATGDELVEPGMPLAPGQIYNSNRYLLGGMLEDLGCEVIDVGLVPDTPEATRAALQRAATDADVVISTGGVSVGEEDHVKDAVAALGSISLWKIAIKPGKPLAYGRVRDKPFIGLPGNPSSVFVTYHVFVVPYLQRMMGLRDRVNRALLRVRAGFNWPQPGKRQEYLRARIEPGDGGASVVLYPNQSSGVLASAAWANCLVVLQPGQTVATGDDVTVLLLPA